MNLIGYDSYARNRAAKVGREKIGELVKTALRLELPGYNGSKSDDDVSGDYLKATISKFVQMIKLGYHHYCILDSTPPLHLKEEEKALEPVTWELYRWPTDTENPLYRLYRIFPGRAELMATFATENCVAIEKDVSDTYSEYDYGGTHNRFKITRITHSQDHESGYENCDIDSCSITREVEVRSPCELILDVKIGKFKLQPDSLRKEQESSCSNGLIGLLKERALKVLNDAVPETAAPDATDLRFAFKFKDDYEDHKDVSQTLQLTSSKCEYVVLIGWPSKGSPVFVFGIGYDLIPALSATCVSSIEGANENGDDNEEERFTKWFHPFFLLGDDERQLLGKESMPTLIPPLHAIVWSYLATFNALKSSTSTL